MLLLLVRWQNSAENGIAQWAARFHPRSAILLRQAVVALELFEHTPRTAGIDRGVGGQDLPVPAVNHVGSPEPPPADQHQTLSGTRSTCSGALSRWQASSGSTPPIELHRPVHPMDPFRAPTPMLLAPLVQVLPEAAAGTLFHQPASTANGSTSRTIQSSGCAYQPLTTGEKTGWLSGARAPLGKHRFTLLHRP